MPAEEISSLLNGSATEFEVTLDIDGNRRSRITLRSKSGDSYRSIRVFGLHELATTGS